MCCHLHRTTRSRDFEPTNFVGCVLLKLFECIQAQEKPHNLSEMLLGTLRELTARRKAAEEKKTQECVFRTCLRERAGKASKGCEKEKEKEGSSHSSSIQSVSQSCLFE